MKHAYWCQHNAADMFMIQTMHMMTPFMFMVLRRLLLSVSYSSCILSLLDSSILPLRQVDQLATDLYSLLTVWCLAKWADFIVMHDTSYFCRKIMYIISILYKRLMYWSHFNSVSFQQSVSVAYYILICVQHIYIYTTLYSIIKIWKIFQRHCLCLRLIELTCLCPSHTFRIGAFRVDVNRRQCSVSTAGSLYWIHEQCEQTVHLRL